MLHSSKLLFYVADLQHVVQHLMTASPTQFLTLALYKLIYLLTYLLTYLRYSSRSCRLKVVMMATQPLKEVIKTVNHGFNDRRCVH